MPDHAQPEVKRDYFVVALDVDRENAAADAFRKQLGQLLFQLRGKRTRHEVATYLGVHLNTFAKFERGESTPDAWEMLRLSRLFGVPVESLYEGAPPPAGAGEELSHEFVLVPEYGVRAGDDPGHAGREETVGRLAFRRSWLVSRGLRPEDLAVFSAHGDAMNDTVRDGDILLMDTSVQSVRTEGIYVIEQLGERRCKRLQAMIDGSVKIRSDNERYETELLPADHVHLLKVCGKVEWIGGVR